MGAVPRGVQRLEAGGASAAVWQMRSGNGAGRLPASHHVILVVVAVDPSRVRGRPILAVTDTAGAVADATEGRQLSQSSQSPTCLSDLFTTTCNSCVLVSTIDVNARLFVTFAVVHVRTDRRARTAARAHVIAVTHPSAARACRHRTATTTRRAARRSAVKVAARALVAPTGAEVEAQVEVEAQRRAVMAKMRRHPTRRTQRRTRKTSESLFNRMV